MKSINFKIVLSSLAVTLLLGALVVVAASQAGGKAAAATPAQGTAPQTSTTPGTNVTTPMTNTDTYYNIYLQNLATGLGVSKDKLTQSMTQAAKDTIAQAVKDGKLTQAQADSLNLRIDQMALNGRYGYEGVGRGFGGEGHGRGGLGEGSSVLDQAMPQAMKAVADKLGITVAQLQTNLQSGQTLADIAKSKNVAVADLKTTIINTIKPTLDAAVKAGTLTQAQEDSIIQGIQNSDLTQKGLGFGGPGFGHRGFGGPGGNDNDSDDTNNGTAPNPSATPGSGNTN